MHNSQAQSLCGAVAQSLGFANKDHEFWWLATGPSLERLLENCQYDNEHLLTHLRWYHRFIATALGPRPIRGVKPKFQPCPVFDGSACELSVNWKELDPKRTVRFTIEATGYNAGTDMDPFNQEKTKELLIQMAKEMPSLDLTQFDVFAEELFLPPQVAATLIPKLPPATPLSQVWVAFDLLRGNVMAKVYFMPVLKWIHTGISTEVLAYNAARKCNGKYGSFDAPIALFNSYLKSFTPVQAPVVEMVAIDCIDSPSSRVKMYLRTSVNTLAKAKDTYTLGGRLSGDAINAGLKALGDLWPILFRLDGADIEDVQVSPRRIILRLRHRDETRSCRTRDKNPHTRAEDRRD